MTQAYQSIELASQAGFAAPTLSLETRILIRPGQTLTEAECVRVVESLRDVARSHRGADLRYGVLSGRKEWLDRAIITLVEDKRTGLLAGFSAMLLLECDLRGRSVTVVHSGLNMVRKGYQGRGVAWRLSRLTTATLFVQNRFRPFWMSNVSQVPAAVGMFIEGTRGAFPRPEPGGASPEHTALAREIMAKHRTAFGVGDEAVLEEERLVIRNAYTGGSDGLRKSWAEVTLHRDPRVNEMCAAELDYDRGDDFLQLGQMTAGTILHGLWRSLREAFGRRQKGAR